jgi:hypothetical protein
MGRSGNFFREGAGGKLHPTYAFCLRDPRSAVRTRIEAMWSKYEPYCPDPHFLSDAAAHFTQRTWEMYLACLMLDKGFPLIRPPSDGPDICIDLKPRIWIEAIAVGAGNGPDYVRGPRERIVVAPDPACAADEFSSTWARDVPSEESVILRCTSAMAAKNESRAADIAKGVVKEEDAYIVAVSLAEIDDAFFHFSYDFDWPVLLQALFGIGEERLLSAERDGEKPRLFRGTRPVVAKQGGTQIPTTGFTSPVWQGISGAFGIALDVVNSWPDGHQMMFVNNPSAAVPVPTGTFAFGMEYVAANGRIQRNDHRTPASRPGASGSEDR